MAVVNSLHTKTHSSKEMTEFSFENADAKSICYYKQRKKSTLSLSSECVKTKLCKPCTSFTSYPHCLCGMVWHRTLRVNRNCCVWTRHALQCCVVFLCVLKQSTYWMKLLCVNKACFTVLCGVFVCPKAKYLLDEIAVCEQGMLYSVVWSLVRPKAKYLLDEIAVCEQGMLYSVLWCFCAS